MGIASQEKIITIEIGEGRESQILNWVTQWFEEAKKNVLKGSISFETCRIRKCAEELGFLLILKKLEISEEELGELEKKGYKNEAIRRLKEARNNINVSGNLNMAKNYAELSGNSFEDIEKIEDQEKLEE